MAARAAEEMPPAALNETEAGDRWLPDTMPSKQGALARDAHNGFDPRARADSHQRESKRRCPLDLGGRGEHRAGSGGVTVIASHSRVMLARTA